MRSAFHRVVAMLILITALATIGLAPRTAHASYCSSNWNGSVSGIGVHGHSCLDWPSSWTYQGFGQSWSDASIATIGAKNQGIQVCDGVAYTDWTTPWNWQSGTTFSSAGSSYTIYSCTWQHLYQTVSNHYFIQGEQYTSPQTNVST